MIVAIYRALTLASNPASCWCKSALFLTPLYEVSVITGDRTEAPERLTVGVCQQGKVGSPLQQPAH